MKIIDLSREISNSTPVYPGDPSVNITQVLSLDKGDPCCLSSVGIGSHTATHCDAFSHFVPGGKTVDRLPLEHFFGKAAIVDLDISDGLVKVSRLKKQLDTLENVSILILRTGFERYSGTEKYFSGMPKFDGHIAGMLMEKGIITLGVDMPSVEGLTGPKEIHEELLSNSIAIVEGLVRLDEISEKYFTFCALPLKIKGCDGSPVRAAAILDNGASIGS